MQIIFDKKNKYNGDMENALLCAAKQCSVPGNTEVYINLVTPLQIRRLNRTSRQKDAVTDVLSFPYIGAKEGKLLAHSSGDINPQTGNIMLGEICLCPQIAANQAEEFGHGLRREMTYLAVHGFLHILGFDHEQDTDRTVMRTAEEQVMQSCGLPAE